MKSYATAVAFITVVILIAHLMVGEPYLWYRNSISQLAGQAYQYAWIMQAGFVGFGLLVQIAGIQRMQAARSFKCREAAIMLYGLGILCSGIFCAAPFVENVPYSQQQAQLHSLFATAAGVALSAAILLFAVTDAPKSRRVVHAIALILIMGLSFLFSTLPAISGAIQRLLWVAGFAWLVYLGSSTAGSDGAPRT